MSKGKIGIVGSGLIGRSWAMLFASAGYDVALFDVDPAKIDEALADIEKQLKSLQDKRLLRGTLSAEEQHSLVHKAASLADCVRGSLHVQECVFENLELKQKVFEELDEKADDNVVLCSSSSCFPPSKFSANLKHRKQVIVGHPVNPPYYVPLVEIIPAPWTDPQVTSRTRAIMLDIGQKPVVLKKEVEGFVLNRIQYAILNECWRLIDDGVMDTADVDTVMSEGLGMRYAFLGPLETAHLNAQGMLEYCDKYAKGIVKVSETFGPVPSYDGATLEKVNAELVAKMPLQDLPKWRQWRDSQLAALSKLKRDASCSHK
ncbi:lambda-crystallin-like [Ornithodoros turicata]|uniref:lambda-crystallin-like n=1 Tax=Ornithodoros turicata TaxID=34597 RepID=UPI0031394655